MGIGPGLNGDEGVGAGSAAARSPWLNGPGRPGRRVQLASRIGSKRKPNRSAKGNAKSEPGADVRAVNGFSEVRAPQRHQHAHFVETASHAVA